MYSIIRAGEFVQHSTYIDIILIVAVVTALDKNEQFVHMIVSCAAGMFENLEISHFVSHFTPCVVTLSVSLCLSL